MHFKYAAIADFVGGGCDTWVILFSNTSKINLGLNHDHRRISFEEKEASEIAKEFADEIVPFIDEVYRPAKVKEKPKLKLRKPSMKDIEIKPLL
jgi:hypothetical protein